MNSGDSIRTDRSAVVWAQVADRFYPALVRVLIGVLIVTLVALRIVTARYSPTLGGPEE